jgi:hypothetical protein
MMRLTSVFAATVLVAAPRSRTVRTMRFGCLVGLVPLVAACSPAGPGTPSADEYAVWSAAADAEFAGRYRLVFVDPHTATPIAYDSSDIERFRAHGLPADLVDDYVTRNRHVARVHSGRLSTRKLPVLPELGGPVDVVGHLIAGRWLTFSRVGFDRSGNRALVTVRVLCGDMCGESAMLVLARGSDGRWRRTDTLMEYVS